jgi:hypothetical protein
MNQKKPKQAAARNTEKQAGLLVVSGVGDVDVFHDVGIFW